MAEKPTGSEGSPANPEGGHEEGSRAAPDAGVGEEGAPKKKKKKGQKDKTQAGGLAKEPSEVEKYQASEKEEGEDYDVRPRAIPQERKSREFATRFSAVFKYFVGYLKTEAADATAEEDELPDPEATPLKNALEGYLEAVKSKQPPETLARLAHALDDEMNDMELDMNTNITIDAASNAGGRENEITMNANDLTNVLNKAFGKAR